MLTESRLKILRHQLRVTQAAMQDMNLKESTRQQAKEAHEAIVEVLRNQPTSQNLRPLAHQAIQHWKEFLPKMYARLKKAGTLESEALRAAEQTLEDQAVLMDQGIPQLSAWEMVRERYIFMPEEPGATPEPENSEGYLVARDINRLLCGIGQEDEEES